MPKVGSSLCTPTLIGLEQAKDMLGWREEDETEFGSDYDFITRSGTKVRLEHAAKTKPLDRLKLEFLIQEILTEGWVYNGQTIVSGKDGSLIDGKHRLLALVLACDEIRRNPAQWDVIWKELPQIQTALSRVDTSDRVLASIDSSRPLSLRNALYRHRRALGRDLSEKAVVDLCSHLEHSVRLLWDRTGCSENPYTCLLTNAGAVTFVMRHYRLFECIRQIYDIGFSKIRFFISPGYAAGLLYLMACNRSDPIKYRDDRSEESLVFYNWKLACDFWKAMAMGTEKVRHCANMIKLYEREFDLLKIPDRMALIIKTWIKYHQRKKAYPKDIELDYEVVEGGNRVLAEYPRIGGIDTDLYEVEDTTIVVEPEPLFPPNNKTMSLTSKSSGGWSVGDVAWVCKEDGDDYLATLIEEPYDTSAGPMVTVRGDDGDWEESLDSLHLTKV